tara:strand:+ start:7898 stop:11455 length:3558 start_codon:yes stop_codon:yes gene_type:complete
MAKINDEAILQSIIPVPILTNVVLETRDDNGNHLNKISSNNPHVQEENNAPAPSDGTKDLASINIVLQNTFSNNSKLPFSMATTVDDVTMDPKNYFSLSLIAASNLSHLDKVSSDEFIKKYIKWGIHDAWTDTYDESLPSGIESRTISLNDSINEQGAGEGEFEKYKKYKTHDPKTNMEVLNIPYEAEMFFEGDLHLIAFVHINEEASKDLLGINSLPDNFLIYGPLDTNSVVVDGKANNTKTVFFRADKQDEIWNGPYQSVNGVFTTAPSGYPLNKKVISNNIVSDMRKIDRVEPTSLDFKSLENDVYSFLKYNYPKDNVKLHHNLSSYISPLTMTTDKSGANKLMFSINFRKLLRDNTPFAMFLDADSDHAVQEHILSAGRILSIRVTRRRIKNKIIDNQSSAVGAVQSEYQSFNKYPTEDDSLPILVVSSKDGIALGSTLEEKSNFQETTIVSHPTGPDGPTTTSTQTIKIGDIKELDGISYLSSQNLNGVRHFYITDSSAASIFGGEYQYSIDLNIRNAAKEYVKSRIAAFRGKINDLEKYYNMAVGSSVASGKTTVNYNILYQKFTQTFINKSEQKPNPTAQGSHWELAKNALLEFTNMMQIFYSGATRDLDVDFPETEQNKVIPKSLQPKEFDKQALYNQLTNLCSPQNGSPRGIESCLSMISTFVDTMSGFMGDNISSNKQGSTGASQNIGPSITTTQEVINFHHDFNNLYKTSIAKHMGYECLRLADEEANTNPAVAGIKTLSLADYDLRSKQENYKFFKPESLEYDPTDGTFQSYTYDLLMSSEGTTTYITTGVDPEASAYSYLTPSYVCGLLSEGDLKNIQPIGGAAKTYNLAHKAALQKYKAALLQIIRTNLAKSSIGSADISLTADGGFNYSLGHGGHSEIRNILKTKEIMSSLNCTVSEQFDSPILRIPHNQMIEATKNKNWYKEVEIEAAGGDESDIKLIPTGEDYDENGNFKLKMSNKDPLIQSRKALELIIMKKLLPTIHELADSLGPNFRDSLQLYNLADSDSLLWNIVYEMHQQAGDSFASIDTKFSALPNQIISLIHASSHGHPESENPSTKFWMTVAADPGEGALGALSNLGLYTYYHFNYKTIFTVQALTGYENNGDVMSPIWQLLTPDLLQQMRAQNSDDSNTVYCRLVNYHEPLFNVTTLSEQDPMYVPLYDEYFTIENTEG